MSQFRIEPRFSETDAYGVINCTALPVWFEEARIALFRVLNPGLQRETWNLMLKKFDVDVLRPILHDAPVDITTGIERVAGSTMEVLQLARQRGEDVATMRTLMVYCDRQTLSPIQIPGDVKTRLLEYRVSDEAQDVE